MRKLTHSESEIVGAVKELEAGVPAETVCRRLNVSKSTLYQWRRKYSWMDAPRLARLKELEAENARLKRMYADAALDNRLLREVIEKKL